MEATRKITVEVPAELLEKAQAATESGITETIRTGLQLLAASRTYAKLRQFRGKYRLPLTLDQLKDDR
jgi:Arc/MetJ-type ribon-helix-helix transcriptional regulator